MADTTEPRRRWVRPEATHVRLGAEVTSYAGLDPLIR
ncbi:pyrroloquinoline quinone precursor peptide PqqA [Planosporangium flavigriseum]|nr:pyrroloquinoline quinone precursor peptide PqqA [Planosporangium flavigriseum]NJC65492.1 pyrroloquinoline quinone precursor peptide PqqA [Planosporangium flavigriseum]